jgi:hypothetical protein
MLDQLLLSAGLFKLQELLISMLQVFAKHSSRAHRATDKLSVLRKERSSWNHSSSVALSTSCIVMVRSTMVSLVANMSGARSVVGILRNFTCVIDLGVYLVENKQARY